MKVAVPRMTIEELDRLPNDGNRYELIDGELFVTAAPRIKHQRISIRLTDWLSPFARAHRLGEVFAAPTDVTPEAPRQTKVQPDILFVARDRAHIINQLGIYGPPDLVIEISSESSYRADVQEKFDLYRRCGVKEYWIVYPDDRRVLVYRFAESAEPRKLVPGDVLTTPLLPGLEIEIRALFEEYE